MDRWAALRRPAARFPGPSRSSGILCMAVPPERPTLTPAAIEALRRREAAQAAALRENLRRRKQQARERQGATPVEPDGEDPGREG